MKKVFIYITISIISLTVQAQNSLVDYFMPNTVEMVYPNAIASGVIVGDSNSFYLVTAKHCLIDDKNNLIGKDLLLIYYHGDASFEKADTLYLDLTKSLHNHQIKVDSVYDIGIIKIGRITGKTPSGKLLFNYLEGVEKRTKNAVSGLGLSGVFSFDEVLVGNDCYIFGFPSSLKSLSANDYDFSRPLIRKGVIAGKNKNRGTIILDCAVYKGNSGGPVFAFDNDNNQAGLIGIISRYIPYVENDALDLKKINITNSGYTVVIPIEYALRLMNNFVK